MCCYLGLQYPKLTREFEELVAVLYNPEGRWPFDDERWSLCSGVTPHMILEWAKQRRHSVHAFHQRTLIFRHVPDDRRHRKTLMFSFSNGHFWLMDSPPPELALTHVITPHTRKLDMVTVERDSRTPADYRLWEGPGRFSGEIPTPGLWRVPESKDLLAIRAELLASGRVPRVHMSGWHAVSHIAYQYTRQELRSLIEAGVLDESVRTARKKPTFAARVIPLAADHTARAAEDLCIVPGCETYASFAHRALTACLREQRVRVPAARRQQIAQEQNNACKICGDALGANWELDHEVPVCTTVASAPPTYQALCQECHRAKSGMEAHYSPSLESHLSESVWQALVAGPPCLSLIMQAAEPPHSAVEYADRSCSRTNILKTSAYPWPVAIPHDEVEAYQGKLGDFNYVITGVPRDAAEIENLLPLRGNGWYHISCVELARERGLDPIVTHVLRCTAHVEPDKFRRALNEVLSALPDDHMVEENGRLVQVRPRRQACNELVGYWGKRRMRDYVCETTSIADDAHAQRTLNGGGSMIVRNVPGFPELQDYVYEIEKHGRHTCYLLHRAVLDQEVCELTRLYLRAKATSRSFKLYELNTDSILYRGARLVGVDGIKTCTTTGHRMKAKHVLPVRRDPQPEKHAPWRVLTEDEAVQAVRRGESLFVEALAGCGKSTLLRRLVGELRALGKSVRCLGPTHVSVQNLEDSAHSPMTIARFLHAYGAGQRNRTDVLVIDELSLVDPYHWCRLATIFHHSQCQVLAAADFNQLQPVVTHYMGCRARCLRDTQFLKEFCGHNRLVLTECRRADERLFRLYASIAHSERPLEDDVALARQLYPKREGHCRVNLCTSHAMRERLVAALQLVFKPADAVLVENQQRAVEGQKNRPQDLWLWPGCELICASRLHNLRNQCSYFVVGVGPETVTLRAAGEGSPVQEFKRQDVVRLFRSSFARTYHSAQGLGFPEVRLWNCDDPNFTREHLVTGLSRSRGVVDFGRY